MLIFLCTWFLLALRFCVATRSKKHFNLFHFRSREGWLSTSLSCKPVKWGFIFFVTFINGHWLHRCHETEPSFLQTQVDGGIVCLLVIFLRPTPQFTGGKKHSEERAALFASVCNCLVRTFIQYHC